LFGIQFASVIRFDARASAGGRIAYVVMPQVSSELAEYYLRYLQQAI